jgi:hypothetical protein
MSNATIEQLPQQPQVRKVPRPAPEVINIPPTRQPSQQQIINNGQVKDDAAQINKGREAVNTMLQDLDTPENTSIEPDKLMPTPVRRCKKCGFVGFPNQMATHKCIAQ